MLQLSAVTPGSDVESESTQSRAVDTLKKRTRDGSIPLLAGGVMLARALTSSTGKGRTASQVFAATALVGIGFRQRRHHSTVSPDTVDEREHHSGTGTSEQRIDSHDIDRNPRDIDEDPPTESDSDGDTIQFSDEQISDSDREDDDPSSGDPRIDEETAEVDLSEASMADEASEAAGPQSVQSQPTQTDSVEPEETPEEDSSSEDSNMSDEEVAGEEGEESTEEDEGEKSA